MTDDQQKLKDFIDEHLCFDSLKKMGFFPKATRRTNYEAIAARMCEYFGYETIYEYGRDLRMVHEGADSGVVVGEFADTVNKKGELQPGGGFMLSCGPPTVFACPVCTKEQDAEAHAAFRNNRMYARIRCKGCKRPLQVGVPGFGSGPLTVQER